MNHSYFINIQTKEILLTKAGLESIKDKLNAVSSKRHQIVRQLRLLTEDNSEEYTVSSQIRELEDLESQRDNLNIVLQRAKTIESDVKPNTVMLGSTVGLTSDHGDVSYTIVSPLEIDLASSKIPEDGILGAAVLKKNLGDTFSIVTPKGVRVTYRVTSIS